MKNGAGSRKPLRGKMLAKLVWGFVLQPSVPHPGGGEKGPLVKGMADLAWLANFGKVCARAAVRGGERDLHLCVFTVPETVQNCVSLRLRGS